MRIIIHFSSRIRNRPIWLSLYWKLLKQKQKIYRSSGYFSYTVKEKTENTEEYWIFLGYWKIFNKPICILINFLAKSCLSVNRTRSIYHDYVYNLPMTVFRHRLVYFSIISQLNPKVLILKTYSCSVLS